MGLSERAAVAAALSEVVQYLGVRRTEAVAVPFETKPSLMRLAENVVVVNCSQKQQKLPVRLDLWPSLILNKLRPPKERCLLAGAEYEARRHLGGNLSEFQSGIPCVP